MPYKSKAQAAKFHIMEKEGKIAKSTVKEYDKASKGMKLPEHSKKSAQEDLKSADKMYKDKDKDKM